MSWSYNKRSHRLAGKGQVAVFITTSTAVTVIEDMTMALSARSSLRYLEQSKRSLWLLVSGQQWGHGLVASEEELAGDANVVGSTRHTKKH
jgi:hypothetical protein